MADVTVVAANVRPLGSGIDFRATAGEAMTPGQPVYMSGNDEVSLADGSAVATSFCVGVVIGGAKGGATIADGEAVDVRAFGLVTGYSTNMAANIALYVDDDPGIIATTAGTKSSVIGFGVNASTMFVTGLGSVVALS